MLGERPARDSHSSTTPLPLRDHSSTASQLEVSDAAAGAAATLQSDERGGSDGRRGRSRDAVAGGKSRDALLCASHASKLRPVTCPPSSAPVGWLPSPLLPGWG